MAAHRRTPDAPAPWPREPCNQDSHITVTYKSLHSEVTRVYAVNEHISRELGHKRNWLGCHLSGENLQAWLETKGCQLDSPDGPALVRTYPNGAQMREYYRDGKRHRADVPAHVASFSDGTRIETYYRDGKRHRPEGPAYVETHAGGNRCEEYYRDGKRHRADGPAIVERKAGRSTYERYFLDDVEFQKDAYDAIKNPLLTGLPLSLANGGQEAVDALLREASAEQSAPGRPDRKHDYIPPPHL